MVKVVASNNVRSLPPPAKAVSDALPADKRDDLQALLKATAAHGFWKGAGLSGPVCFMLGALTAIWLTVQLVPITSDIVSRLSLIHI